MKLPVYRPYPLPDDCAGGKEPLRFFKQLCKNSFDGPQAAIGVYERVEREIQRANSNM